MAPRQPRRDPLRGRGRSYPAPLERLIGWYDALTNWQQIGYGVACMLALVACAGYLLGVGSTTLLRRGEAQPTAPTVVAEPAPAPSPSPTAGPSPAPRR